MTFKLWTWRLLAVPLILLVIVILAAGEAVWDEMKTWPKTFPLLWNNSKW